MSTSCKVSRYYISSDISLCKWKIRNAVEILTFRHNDREINWEEGKERNEILYQSWLLRCLHVLLCRWSWQMPPINWKKSKYYWNKYNKRSSSLQRRVIKHSLHNRFLIFLLSVLHSLFFPTFSPIAGVNTKTGCPRIGTIYYFHQFLLLRCWVRYWV